VCVFPCFRALLVGLLCSICCRPVIRCVEFDSPCRPASLLLFWIAA
jgi:hypothetical protein